jgi:DNA polymerase
MIDAPAKSSRKGALSKAAVRALLDRADLPPAARRALEIRQDAARTSTAKITTLAAAVGPDGRIRDTIEFHAASTGRAGGKMLQPQNLPRDSVKPEDWLTVLSVMARGLPFFRTEMPDASPMGTLVRMLRGSIVPSPGHVFVGGDYAQIEARVVLWLAGETAALELLRTGGKLYESMAAAIYGCRPEDIKNPSEERQVGKSAVLGAGFGLGWRKFVEYVFNSTGIRISEELAQEAIGTYRTTYAGVPKLWRETEAAAKAAIRAPSSRVTFAGECASFQVTRDSQWMTMTLPGGRRLRYYRPEIREDEREGWEGNEIVSFMGVNQYTRKFQRETTWGGTLVENLVQATARDLLMVARARVEAHGWPVVLHVHDELLAEIPEDKADGADMILRELMEAPLPWTTGLPVAAETRTRNRFGK